MTGFVEGIRTGGVMQAVSICMIKDIPFTFNTVLTSHNRGELKEVVELAEKLESRGLRFGHLVHTLPSMAKNLELSPGERREAEAIVWQLQRTFLMPIVMAPGYYITDLFPCAPLKMQEFNIDWQGNVTLCCHFSGHGAGVGNGDVIGSLNEMSFFEAYARLLNLKKRFHLNKLERYYSGNFKDSDYFSCWYCLNYFKKVNWFEYYPESAWSSLVWKKHESHVCSNALGKYGNESFDARFVQRFVHTKGHE